MASTAAARPRPSYLPEFTQRPFSLSAYHSCQASSENGLPGMSMTCLIGSAYFFAKWKSRSSCAGTAITAPSP